MMRPHTEKAFCPLCKLIDNGRLEFWVPSGRFTYDKLADGVNLPDLDLSGSPAIEEAVDFSVGQCYAILFHRTLKEPIRSFFDPAEPRSTAKLKSIRYSKGKNKNDPL